MQYVSHKNHTHVLKNCLDFVTHKRQFVYQAVSIFIYVSLDNPFHTLTDERNEIGEDFDVKGLNHKKLLFIVMLCNRHFTKPQNDPGTGGLCTGSHGYIDLNS